QLANGKQGVEVSGVGLNLNNLGGSGISLANATADVDVIEPPQVVEGPKGTSGRTDQVRTTVRATLLGGMLGNLAGAAVTLDLGTASGTGTILDIDCSTPERFTVRTIAGLLATSLTIDITLLGIPIEIAVVKAPNTAGFDPQFTR